MSSWDEGPLHSVCPLPDGGVVVCISGIKHNLSAHEACVLVALIEHYVPSVRHASNSQHTATEDRTWEPGL
jgi:hypothetical protein